MKQKISLLFVYYSACAAGIASGFATGFADFVAYRFLVGMAYDFHYM